jgi:hypothetical protein
LIGNAQLEDFADSTILNTIEECSTSGFAIDRLINCTQVLLLARYPFTRVNQFSTAEEDRKVVPAIFSTSVETKIRLITDKPENKQLDQTTNCRLWILAGHEHQENTRNG